MSKPEADGGVAIESSPLLPDEYRCAMCGGVFKTAWTDEEARAEQEANGWGSISQEDCVTVCDDCYQQMIALDPPSDFNERQANTGADRT